MSTPLVGKIYLSISAQNRLRITDRYSIHRVLLDMFEYQKEVGGNESSGFQWVDRGQTIFGRRIDFLSTVPVNAACPAEDVSIEIRELPQNFLEHQNYRFQVLMNTCRFSNGRRIPILKEDDIACWFKEKASRNGMDALIYNIDNKGVDEFKKGRQKVAYARARISGCISVTDKSAFQNAFFKGLGKGRAFGFGFLQLAIN